MAKKDFLPAPDATTQATIDRRKAKQEAKAASAGVQAEPVNAPIDPVTTRGHSGSAALLDGATPKQEQNPAQGSQALLSDIDRQIKELQDQWAAASAEGNQEKMDAAHMEAEKLRASQGYLGGADGSGFIPIVMGKGNKGEDGTPRQQLSAIDGGYSANDVEQWINAYMAASSDGATYHNGFSPEMNKRSKNNFIRQQMLANSEAWENADAAQREYLHAQNVQLAALLPKASAGGGKSTFNEALGRWETEDGNLGYGYVTRLRDDASWLPDAEPMTAEQREQFASDTGRYYNYVDYDLPLHYMDNSSGYTGSYENFINGPYGQLLAADALGRPNMSTYENLIGDGFMDEYDYRFIDGKAPPKDANGDYILYQPMRKDNNSLTPYTKSKAAYVDEYGIIQPGSLDGTKYAGAANNMWLNGGTPVEDPGENFGVTWGTRPTAHTRLGGSFTPMEEFGFGGGNGNRSYEEQINAQYDADLQAKLSALEQEYNLALAELEQTQRQTGDQYFEGRRQAAGSAEREAAAWRELANAQGVSSGAIGQTDLVNRGQLQSEMNAMNSAEAQALAAIEQQRAILAQSYQLKIQQAEAENDYARAQALLQEAQRADEVLRQEQQAQAQNMLSLMSMFGG